VRFHCIGPEVAALEAELFGQERGHGATARQKQGKYEAAEGGTLLLDALEELPAELQTRLLRAIEQAGSERAGSDTAPSATVRLICATSRDLAALVQQGGFREDLYYRLNVISISIPPLRDRPDDVPVLARHFVECYARQLGVPPAEISLHAIDELVRYPWPGNVRELEHVMERALALCGGGQADAGGKKTQIRPEHILPLGVEAADAPLPAIELGAAGPLNLTETVADIEKRMILLALRQCENNQARAAQRLGIPRTTLRDKMAKYSIPGM
jgi:DNA-binding NtrC family response regulator